MDRVSRRGAFRRLGLGVVASLTLSAAVGASVARAQERPMPYTDNDLVENGHRFFGSLSRGLAEAIQSATKRWGQPNAYILGQEAGGAFVGGLRYGEGAMYTRNAGDRKVFWQGPSVGFDAGADGDRTMMLVYALPSTHAIYQRFGGIDGSEQYDVWPRLITYVFFGKLFPPTCAAPRRACWAACWSN